MQRDLLAALNAERAARRAAILVTDLDSGNQRLVRETEFTADPLAGLLEERIRLGKSGPAEVAGQRLFLLVQVPRRHLIVLGAVHISQALAPMAKLADLDMRVIDPRSAFATPERFPGVEVIAEWPQDVLPRIGLDRFTALAVLTHDPRIDDPALAAALSAGCFYIGALGSQKTHAKRLERLRASGFADSQLQSIHAPIGLDIGAVSPAEIAVAILGEIIAALRRKPLRAQAAA
ncbi:MAG: XdhC family protein [Methylovirgula sp.]